MSAVVEFKGVSVDRVPAGLSDRLVWLTRFGRPSVGVYSTRGGWHASVDMRIADEVKGTSFEVKSDFGHESPDTAVDQLVERLIAALSKLAKGSA